VRLQRGSSRFEPSADAVVAAAAQLWLTVCRANCQSAVLDMAAVPYFVHSQDLKKIAPLWKEYVLIVSPSPPTHRPRARARERQGRCVTAMNKVANRDSKGLARRDREWP
jgi:hypothetical protein